MPRGKSELIKQKQAEDNLTARLETKVDYIAVGLEYDEAQKARFYRFLEEKGTDYVISTRKRKRGEVTKVAQLSAENDLAKSVSRLVQDSINDEQTLQKYAEAEFSKLLSLAMKKHPISKNRKPSIFG